MVKCKVCGKEVINKDCYRLRFIAYKSISSGKICYKDLSNKIGYGRYEKYKPFKASINMCKKHYNVIKKAANKNNISMVEEAQNFDMKTYGDY